MEDMGKKLYELISAEFESSLKKLDLSPKTLSEVSAYSAELGRLLRRCIEKYVTEEALPDGRLYYNIAKSILEPALRRNYQLINAAADEAQKAADTLSGIHLAPQHPDFPEERLRNVIGAASQQGIKIETAVRRLASPAENITQSFSDDYMQENAEFRSRAGLGVRIERTTDGSCCKWCSSKAGTYRYPDQTPKDIFRRHDNCGCLVEYITEKGRQNVWAKKWWQDKERAERIAYAESLPKPTKYTPEQARELERRLTEERESGIIHSLGDDSSPKYEKYSYEPKVSKEVRAAFDEEYTKAVNKFGNITTIRGVQVLNDRSSDEGTYNDNSRFISLRHAEKKKGLQKMADIAREKFKEGKWSTSDPHHAIRHEIGHAIQLERRMNDPKWSEKLERLTKIYIKASNTSEDYSLPSKYSEKTINEFLSECIAAGYVKNQSKTVREVCGIINEGVIL